MKQTFLSIVLFASVCSANAQTIEVYEYNDDGSLSSTPLLKTDKKVKVIFKEASSSKEQKAETKVEGTTTIYNKTTQTNETYTKAVGGTIADYVDLGLTSGTLWATHNLGATKSTEYGAYIAWGENGTEEEGYVNGIKYKDGIAYYGYDNLKYCNGTNSSFSKYVCRLQYQFDDEKYSLENVDDAAYVNWGENWFTPTESQFEELKKQCTWKDEIVDDVAGTTVTGPNGQSIFLPHAGGSYNATSFIDIGDRGRYYTKNIVSNYCYNAYFLLINGENQSWTNSRRDGLSIRPVYVK